MKAVQKPGEEIGAVTLVPGLELTLASVGNGLNELVGTDLSLESAPAPHLANKFSKRFDCESER